MRFCSVSGRLVRESSGFWRTARFTRFVTTFFLLAGIASCGPEPHHVRPPAPPAEPLPRPETPVPEAGAPFKELPLLRHSVQVGAFSRVSNAVRLSELLQKRGLDAFYFMHESGLFKVRFGDFPTKEAALSKVEELRAAGIVDEVYIVGPEDYASAQVRLRGKLYLRDQLVRTARTFLGIPYKWGGSSVEEGFDCSGLSMAVYQLNGLNLPRHSRTQWDYGRSVSATALEKGDLVFFAMASKKRIDHVGIYVGDGRFIHAPSRGKDIRISSLHSRYFTERYVGARTYI